MHIVFFSILLSPSDKKRLCGEQVEPCRRLFLLPKHLPVGLAIGIKAIMFTAFPSGLQFGPTNVPVRTTFLQYSTQVLPKLFDGRSAKKPVAVVDLEYNETRFEDDDMGNHRIVLGVRVLGDVEILLNLSSRIGQKSPMSADTVAVLIRQKHVVGTDGDEPGITDFHLVVKLDQTLGLAPVLRAEPSPAKHQDHGIWPLQIGKLATFARVIGQLIIGKYCASYNVGSHAVQPPLRQYNVSVFYRAL